MSAPPPMGGPIAPPPRRRSLAGTLLTFGCLSTILLAVAAGVAAWVFLNQPAPKVIKPRTEVIKYGPVKDRERGPSTVKPSGRSARTLKTRPGVIDRDAREVTRARDISYPRRPAVCRDNAHLTDILKDVAFDVDRELRKSTPLAAGEEMALGDKIHKELRRHPKFKGKVDTRATRKWRAYLARVSQPILAEIKRKDITYHFHVIDDPTVNAFAIPGGHIYFFTGLLENKGGQWLANEAQLAGILAHEISHIDLGHCAAVFQYLKRLGLGDDKNAEIPATLVLTLARGAFSSNQEDEADFNATDLLYIAQYDPDQFVEMWKTWDSLQAPRPEPQDRLGAELENLLRSHSDPRKRACTVLRRTQELVAEQDRFDRFYIGKRNFKKRTPRTRRQY